MNENKIGLVLFFLCKACCQSISGSSSSIKKIKLASVDRGCLYLAGKLKGSLENVSPPAASKKKLVLSYGCLGPSTFPLKLNKENVSGGGSGGGSGGSGGSGSGSGGDDGKVGFCPEFFV